MGIEQLAGSDYLGTSRRLRELAEQGLADLLMTATYGLFMPWQPDDVDARAIALAQKLRRQMAVPESPVYLPFESLLTPGDIEVIRQAGYDFIFGANQYRYWFGWIEDWLAPNVKENIESLRKIHRVNGMNVLFDTRIGNYQGFSWDERWGEIDWDNWSQWGMYEGTDQGLHLWWRRILLDMAQSEDQQQFFTIGTDIQLMAWMFEPEANWTMRWLAAHPWIEVVTLADIAGRGWSVIDDGHIDLADNELLIRHHREGDTHYNAYFPWFYYGGTADGHSPLIAAGEQIEAYFDYVPYLRDGEQIPSGRIMGDDDTPGSIISETLESLRACPDNEIADLAWLSYLLGVAEQTSHAQTLYPGGTPSQGDWGGQYLHPVAKMRANLLSNANKIAAASRWAAQVEAGVVAPQPQLVAEDLDLDGEVEYQLSNDRVFAIFENDGGRLQYAFAASPGRGAVAAIAPTYGHHPVFEREEWSYEQGEVCVTPIFEEALDASFVEDISYPVYETATEGTRLTFISPDGAIEKTFELEGDILRCAYSVTTANPIAVGFGLVTDLSGLFREDWSTLLGWATSPESLGISSTGRASAHVFFDDDDHAERATFNDSPARAEGREREDPSTYPTGHWMMYPYSSIIITGGRDLTITLALRPQPSSSFREPAGRIAP